MKSSQARKHRESEFWDSQVGTKADGALLETNLKAVPWEVRHQPAYQFYLQALGDLQGKRVLECGCGDGRLSVLLAEAGAEVYAFDISPVSVELCRRRAVAWEVSHRLIATVADLEHLPYPDMAFDVVCGVFVLHHVNVPIAGRNILRVIKPEGCAVFLENSAANPVLMLGRQRLLGRFNISRFGSPDEYPLTAPEVRSLQLLFGRVRRYFPQMIFLRLALQRLVLAAFPVERFPHGPFRRLGNWLWNLGPRLDDALYRVLPFCRKYSWWQVLVLSRPMRF
jgi:ubiquinone/menaquinone biosynthesis C-methylase UbiE